MKNIKFIHCADLHIDRPVVRISSMNEALGGLLRQSTFESFSKIIELAIKESVDCVLISGDIYDSADKSLQAQLRFRNGLQQLSNEGIPTYIVHGNHDPLNSWSAKLEWPKDVYIFPGDKVECKPLTKNGQVIANIYGISFLNRDIFDNLALRFEAKKEHIHRIGMLHTNIGTNTGHEPYAPCTIQDLSASRMDYWALGHIHAHNILKTNDPAIIYPGCSQSTNPGETGEKGCCLVTLEDGADPDIKFIPTDTVRYVKDMIDISNCTSLDDIISSIREKCEQVAVEMNNRHVVIRLSIYGMNDLDSELRRGNCIDEIVEHVREYFTGKTPWIWLEKLTLRTTGTYDLATLRQSNDFIADIISIYDELENTKSEYWASIHDKLNVLFSTWPGQKYLDELSDSELLELAYEARDWTVETFLRSE